MAEAPPPPNASLPPLPLPTLLSDHRPLFAFSNNFSIAFIASNATGAPVAASFIFAFPSIVSIAALSAHHQGPHGWPHSRIHQWSNFILFATVVNLEAMGS